MIPRVDLSLGFLDALQPAELLLQPGHLLRECVYLVTIAPTKHNLCLQALGGPPNSRVPSAEGLGSYFSPWEDSLGRGICQDGSWPPCLGFSAQQVQQVDTVFVSLERHSILLPEERVESHLLPALPGHSACVHSNIAREHGNAGPHYHKVCSQGSHIWESTFWISSTLQGPAHLVYRG